MGEMMSNAERMAQVVQVLADAGAFGDWLQAHGEVVVGFAMTEMACPLADWLGEVVGSEWLVSTVLCEDQRGAVCVALPPWAQAFVAEVDRRYGWAGSVTGEMALAALREVVR